jgi:hypothetical protein
MFAACSYDTSLGVRWARHDPDPGALQGMLKGLLRLQMGSDTILRQGGNATQKVGGNVTEYPGTCANSLKLPGLDDGPVSGGLLINLESRSLTAIPSPLTQSASRPSLLSPLRLLLRERSQTADPRVLTRELQYG